MFTSALRMVARVGLVALVMALAALGLTQDSRPVSASHTTIFVTNAILSPVRISWPLIIIKNGPPHDFYVWVKDADDPQGVAAFQVDVTYPGSASAVIPPAAWMSVTALVPSATGIPTWLGSTGRSPACLPSPPLIEVDEASGAGHALLGCSTTQPPPAYPILYGPQGSGLVATFSLQGGSQVGPVTLTFTGQTFIIDAGDVQGTTVTPPALIPATVASRGLYVARCADTNGDSFVSAVDVVRILRASQTSDPLYDLDESGIVSATDVVIAVREAGYEC